jgi:hypothetical protein
MPNIRNVWGQASRIFRNIKIKRAIGRVGKVGRCSRAGRRYADGRVFGIEELKGLSPSRLLRSRQNLGEKRNSFRHKGRGGGVRSPALQVMQALRLMINSFWL